MTAARMLALIALLASNAYADQPAKPAPDKGADKAPADSLFGGSDGLL